MASTLEGLEADPVDGVTVQRIIYAVTTLLLTALMAVAVGDGFQLWSVLGVRSAERSASADGYRLGVHYGTVTRPGLATPLKFTVTRPGGFDEPFVLAVDRSYLAMWDENGLSPAPASETARGPWVEWQFDPPPGEEFVVMFDARIEPAVQFENRAGAVQLRVGDEVVAAVEFTTRVLP